MDKKYELTNETKEFYGMILHRIRALKDFGRVRAGDLGGWVEKEDNLSQFGACWVYENAKVYEDAMVYGSAWVAENALVYEDAEVYENAKVYGSAVITGCMHIQKTRDYLTVGPVGSRNDFTTFAKDQNGNVAASCGCFYGTLDEFSEKVGATHGNSNFGAEYRAAIELAKAHFTEEEEQ